MLWGKLYKHIHFLCTFKNDSFVYSLLCTYPFKFIFVVHVEYLEEEGESFLKQFSRERHFVGTLLCQVSTLAFNIDNSSIMSVIFNIG